MTEANLMSGLLPLLVVALGATAVILLAVAAMLRGRRDDAARVEAALREELRLAREETAAQARELRAEVAAAQRSGNETLVATVNVLGTNQKTLLDSLTAATGAAADRMRAELAAQREEQQRAQLALREALDQKLQQLQASNEQKLEQMRRTVDEKLHDTLEKRLGESFRLVSERLEAVQRGLGEMKNLADGVGDLKRVLTNVKERGTWGEYQLGAILEQVLTPDQYAANVSPKDGGEVVEFAIRLPGQGGESDRPVWLPIDAKFPREDYERLLLASENADAEGVRIASAALGAALRKAAKDISEKYIAPPATTDFAVLFLPTEGLYAEVLRQPGLHDELQSRHRVLVAGPTTLAAILNSLRVGFRTLAIEQRSHEVRRLLGAVKDEFSKFGAVLDKVGKQLNTASRTIDETQRRTRAMERKLRDVEQLPAEQARDLLALGLMDEADEDEGADSAPG